MRKLLALTFSLTMFVLFSSQVSAYTTIGYKLIGGVYNRQFTVPSNANYTYNGTTINYGPLIRSAVTSWNNSVDPLSYSGSDQTDVYFTETTDYSQSELDFYVYEYGNTGWAGFTDYYTSGGSQINPGGYPNQDYGFNKVKLNVTYLHGDTSTIKQTVAAHEMGHALGLMHSTAGGPYVYPLMNATISKMSSSPIADDVDGVRAVY